ncbi:hypothetical protein Patl1_30667 [Pistacia atlantica]|uniref:Uncharacterized protein n=1 Tax=Pistacia atlantica TaxID=434234 RepID=A0ACC1ACX7_9ROSI|nr:hypothetical protein Patl1_30667 [Pistacia atlantica]
MDAAQAATSRAKALFGNTTNTSGCPLEDLMKLPFSKAFQRICAEKSSATFVSI